MEYIALLLLEQALMQWIMEDMDGVGGLTSSSTGGSSTGGVPPPTSTRRKWMEVGGPYNAFLIRVSSNYDPIHDCAENTSHKETTNGIPMIQQLALPPPLPNVYHHQQQTSFQRCWLHRMADRFHIRREHGVYGNNDVNSTHPENTSHNNNNNNKNNSNNSLLPYRTLRLFTTPQTTIPVLTLQEYYTTTVLPALQHPSHFVQQIPPPERYVVEATTHPNEKDTTRTIPTSTNISSSLSVSVVETMVTALSVAPTNSSTDEVTHLDTNPNNNNSNNSNNDYDNNDESVGPVVPPPAPMKIMKRASSSSLLSGNMNNNKPSMPPQTGSNSNNPDPNNNGSTPTMSSLDSAYEEKERAYAEARARIFQEDQEAANQNNNNIGVVHENEYRHKHPNYDEAMTVRDDHSETISQENSSSVIQPPPPPTTTTTTSDMKNDPNSVDDSNDNYNPQPPAAPTASTTMRAVYRNRFQEEADPDFQRNRTYSNHAQYIQQHQYMAMTMMMNQGQSYAPPMPYNNNMALPLPHPQQMMMYPTATIAMPSSGVSLHPVVSPTNATETTSSATAASAAAPTFANVVSSNVHHSSSMVATMYPNLRSVAQPIYNHPSNPHHPIPVTQQYPSYDPQYHYPPATDTASTPKQQQSVEDWQLTPRSGGGDINGKNNDVSTTIPITSQLNDTGNSNQHEYHHGDTTGTKLPTLKAAAQEFIPHRPPSQP